MNSLLWKLIKKENGMLFGIATTIFFLTAGSNLLKDIGSLGSAVVFLVWLLIAILGCAFGVVRHADALAHRLGEPFGTLILTLCVTGMEVSMVSAVMLSGHANSTLARDTMFAVIMIVLGGLSGIALVLGAIRHHQQDFNLEGAGAYMSLIVPLAVFGMVMPNFTTTTTGPTFSYHQSLILAVLCLAIYIVFLTIQTVRHKDFFNLPSDENTLEETAIKGLKRHSFLLLGCLVPVVILAEELAHVLKFGTQTLHLPSALSGVIVALLILAPEGLSAIKAAWKNQLQRSVNLLLGSALATIALTIPSVLIVGVFLHQQVQLGLPPHQVVLLCVMLAMSVLTFGKGRTNLLQGAVHLLVFLFWLALIFES